ncbi:uncharacterized protein VP01_14217g1, partial [Puccinia sorghi]
CFGEGKAPAVCCPAKGKINGFEIMAINPCNQSPSKINLTSCQMKDGFNTYKEKVQESPHQIHIHRLWFDQGILKGRNQYNQ